MSVVDEVRDAIRGWSIPEALRAYAEGAYAWDGTCSGRMGELDAEGLAATFSYQIHLQTTKIADESQVRLGASKHRGLPHLPRDMPWPDHLFFEAQIDLAELARVDISGRLPDSGMLYFWQSNRHGTLVQRWVGDPSELEVRPYPSELDDAKYYLRDFRDRPATLRFEPAWLFYINDGDASDYRGLRDVLPPERVEEVSRALGAELCGRSSGFRLYGRPQYWQGEDEGDEPVGFDDDGQPIWGESKPRLLLLQTELGDAVIHFWCDPEQAARGDFTGAWSGFSGT
ncbi:MAG: DUF1963 domain-containing protein [Alphaproteobacteria bacterium]|nr:DUF1963 domain-containing protein [Alphaproteobacteria bacterium]